MEGDHERPAVKRDSQELFEIFFRERFEREGVFHSNGTYVEDRPGVFAHLDDAAPVEVGRSQMQG